MTNGSEAQSQPVLVLEYAALALGMLALVGAIAMKIKSEVTAQPRR